MTHGTKATATVVGQAMVAIAAVVVTVCWIARAPAGADIGGDLTFDALGLYALVLAAWVVHRRPDINIGPLLALYGLFVCVITLSDSYDDLHAQLPAQFPISRWLIVFGSAAFMFWSLPTILLFLYFPDGRLTSPRWRWLIAAFFADFAVLSVVQPFVDRTFDPPHEDVPDPLPVLPHAWAVVAWVVVVLCLLGLLTIFVLSVVAVVRRFRRATGTARAQLKWFALGAFTLPGALLLCWADALLPDSQQILLSVGLLLMLLAVPTATTIGLLRHQLYEVDRALAATVTYTVVTAILLAVFGLTSVLGGVMLGNRSPWVAAVATAVCAAALSPLRTRLRRAVDRRLYPRRRSVLDAIAAFRTDIRAGRALPEQLPGVLAAALQDPDVDLDYRLDDMALEPGVESAPVPAGSVPVMIADYRVGVLSAGPRTSPQLLREVAHAIAFLVEAVRMRLGLANALQEVASSRSRLQQAGYEERRRLERDLHDGAQQRLVALGMNLRLAQRHLTDGSVDVNGLLDASVGELGTAVAELRQIAHGLRPSSLDDGLGPALTSMINRLPVPVAMNVHSGPVPDDVATTAFFVASEAVTNAIKHAGAERIDLDVRQAAEGLHVSVCDDGCGRAELRPGTGLAGLSDRVAAAGGRLQVESRPGFGTRVEAFLPCAS